MKILAVGWENLASLERGPAPDEPGEERLLHLDRPPLSQVGVFAITGPTGAGKSTILDAICLALFNKTPRLQKRGGVKTGRTADEVELPAFDTRNLLRRGAGEARAVCVFEGADGNRWRATWRARRARGAPDGRHQPVDMELRPAEGGNPVGRTLSEVQDAIQARLGLDFEQFCRSVLLAQGDFAAFLSAEGDDRADLLEKVTGTGLYAKLGREAYERAGREEQALDTLSAQREQLGQLDAEARAALEADADWLTFRSEQAETALGLARDALRRRDALDRLAGRRDEARQELAGLQDRWDQAAPQRARRELLETVQGHTPALAAWDQARTQAEGAERGLREAEQALETRSAAWVLAARALLASAQGATRLAEGAVRDADAACARARAEQEQARLALDAREEDLGLLARWGALEPLLGEAVAVVGRLGEAEARREAALRRVEAADEALRAADRAVTKREAEVQEHEALEEAARARVIALDGAGLRAALERAGELQRTAQRLDELARRIGEEKAGLEQLEAEAADAARAAERARAEQVAARAAQEQARQQLPLAETAVRRAEATVEMATHRELLVDGEPCPLCGADEHPFASESPVVDALLADLRAQRDAVRQRLTSAGEEATAAGARAEAADARGARAGKAGQTARARIEGLRAAWDEAAEGLELPAPADGAEALEPALVRLRERVTVELAAAREGLDALRQAEGQAREAADRAKGARRASDAARVARDAAQTAVIAARTAEQAERDATARDRTQLQAVASQLPAGEAARLAAEPAAVREELAARVRAVREEQARLRELEAACRRADELRSRAGASYAEAGARQASIEAELGPEVEPADAPDALPLDRATAAWRAAGTARDDARAAVERARSVLEERQATRAAARASLDEALGALEVDEATLRARVAALPELGPLQRELDALASARSEAATRLTDREGHLEAERARPRPPLLPHEAEETLWTLAGFPDADTGRTAQVALAENAIRALHEARGRCEQKLTEDDRARRAGDELQAAITAQERVTTVWRTMRDLLGDSTGKRFRGFAQSLTLDLLLDEANRHLDELEPRYRLERAPAPDDRALLELQVIDRDLGDEVRPTSSLSGGESFLVSLALALGLSSLSAEGRTIGSLFIDEGFGTLDERTLETALSVLEALQSGGRQVGIISHVQKLAENIGAQVIVQPEAPGLSRVEVAGPGYS